MAEGLPGGANLQEKFFVLRVTAQLLLDDRILTRLVQGFGRCTRSPNDYAAVIVLGENLNSYLFKKDRRDFFHPEIQAELEFGCRKMRNASVDGMLENLNHFFRQDVEWDGRKRRSCRYAQGAHSIRLQRHRTSPMRPRRNCRTSTRSGMPITSARLNSVEPSSGSSIIAICAATVRCGCISQDHRHGLPIGLDNWIRMRSQRTIQGIGMQLPGHLIDSD